jgi:hypothetical protein
MMGQPTVGSIRNGCSTPTPPGEANEQAIENAARMPGGIIVLQCAWPACSVRQTEKSDAAMA